MKSLAKRRRAGTASIEIAVMLPVFIVLLFGALHLHRVTQTSLAVQQEARACAWQYALSGCRSAGTLCTQSKPVHEGAADSEKKGAFSYIASIPVLGSIVAVVFGEAMSAEARGSTPAFMSAGKEDSVATIHLVCNTVSESWEKKIKDALCSMADSALGLKMDWCK